MSRPDDNVAYASSAGGQGMRALAAVAVLAGCLLTVACGLVPEHRPAPVDRAALVGVDDDGDGVRDDVAEAIDRLPVSPQMRTYLWETARVEQRIMLLDTRAAGARDEAFAIAQAANRLISCVPEPLDVHEAWGYADTIQALVEDTSERDAQVGAFAHLIDGRDFVEPTC